MPEHRIIIGEDGQVRMLYNDDLQDLISSLGDADTKRASHVEPAGDGWTADMRPCNDGPVLGPFPTRAEALEVEKQWLLEHGIPTPTC